MSELLPANQPPPRPKPSKIWEPRSLKPTWTTLSPWLKPSTVPTPSLSTLTSGHPMSPL
ncbi:hypothetical protein FOPG_17117 [Fusarium oxysporum f. sp. conglutinans race 2 54008]|uniref:Uncharacterized protein n=1 Tax=Fusarium oxysporum f. sp. conglutinans race 2 54008 TaxID=1089457 RepID=X0H3Z9_FUSOX|nr:hypothetical protein FOPG_17117 [Fusarium oxysporum f. sp. conglutinans race 2 54008]